MKQLAMRKNTFYHIYNRGVLKHQIFKTEADYLYFMYKVARFKRKYKIDISICVLMPNHFHFLLRSNLSPLNISQFMKALQHSYSLHYNAKYKGSGHVFQGPFRRTLKATPTAFKTAYTYIEQNPVKARLVKTATGWPYRQTYGTV